MNLAIPLPNIVPSFPHHVDQYLKPIIVIHTHQAFIIERRRRLHKLFFDVISGDNTCGVVLVFVVYTLATSVHIVFV